MIDINILDPLLRKVEIKNKVISLRLVILTSWLDKLENFKDLDYKIYKEVDNITVLDFTEKNKNFKELLEILCTFVKSIQDNIKKELILRKHLEELNTDILSTDSIKLDNNYIKEINSMTHFGYMDFIGEFEIPEEEPKITIKPTVDASHINNYFNDSNKFKKDIVKKQEVVNNSESPSGFQIAYTPQKDVIWDNDVEDYNPHIEDEGGY